MFSFLEEISHYWILQPVFQIRFAVRLLCKFIFLWQVLTYYIYPCSNVLIRVKLFQILLINRTYNLTNYNAKSCIPCCCNWML